MVQILDDDLFDNLVALNKLKESRKVIEKKETILREQIDKKLSDYDDTNIDVGSMMFIEDETTPLYSIKYSLVERRNLNRDRLLEHGVSINILQECTDITESRRLTFRVKDCK